MPYKFPDLSNGGRDLIITNKEELNPQLTALPNGQGTLQLTTATPTQPCINYPDPDGFFAPVWDNGNTWMTMMIGFYMASAARYDMLMTWTKGGPSGGVSGWGIYLSNGATVNSVETNCMNSAGTGVYLGRYTPALTTGVRLLHVEIGTGAVRQISMWVDTVAQSLTTTAGTGSPYVRDGSESLRVLSRGDGYGNIGRPVGVVGFWRRQLTPAERAAHLQAFNAA